MWNLGFGLPGGSPYDDFDPILIEVLAQFEEWYRREFSHDNYIRKTEDIAIEQRNNLIKVLSKRRR